MNYNLPAGHEAPAWENKYQVALRAVLAQVAGGPRLMPPRPRIRGSAWKVYR